MDTAVVTVIKVLQDNYLVLVRLTPAAKLVSACRMTGVERPLVLTEKTLPIITRITHGLVSVLENIHI